MKTAILVLTLAMTALGVTWYNWGYCESTAAGIVGGDNNWYGVRFTPPDDCSTGNVENIQMWSAATSGYNNAGVRLRIFKFIPSQTYPITEAWSQNYNFTMPATVPAGEWVTYTLNPAFVYIRSESPEFLVAFQSEHAPSQPTWLSMIGYDGEIGTLNRNYVVVGKNMPSPQDWSLSSQGDYMFRIAFSYTPDLTPVLPTSLGNIKATYNQ